MKAKKVKKTIKKQVFKPIAKYIGSVEIYFPQFKKIVNKGDLVIEMPLDEAMARKDFVVANERED